AGLESPWIDTAEIAGPGFINLRLRPSWYGHVVGRVLDEGAGYGGGAVSHPQRLQVEFVSGNPTGPMTVATARNAAYGDALGRIRLLVSGALAARGRHGAAGDREGARGGSRVRARRRGLAGQRGARRRQGPGAGAKQRRADLLRGRSGLHRVQARPWLRRRRVRARRRPSWLHRPSQGGRPRAGLR